MMLWGVLLNRSAETILIILSRGKKLIDLPYTVKGMDVSFSGILSYIEVSLLSLDLFFSHFC